jgi:siroheme synthase-like protein
MARTFLVALCVDGRPCAVVGDDAEAARRAQALRDDGARVVLHWTHSTEALAAASREGIEVRIGPLDPEAIVGAAFVTVVVPQDPALAAPFFAVADRLMRALCCVDQPEFCTFAHVAVARAGPVRIAVSTGGDAPLLARRIREGLEGALDRDFEDFAERVAQVRRAAPKGTRLAATRPLLEGFRFEARAVLPPSPSRGED